LVDFRKDKKSMARTWKDSSKSYEQNGCDWRANIAGQRRAVARINRTLAARQIDGSTDDLCERISPRDLQRQADLSELTTE
jgi:hypothetical protein